MISAMQCVAFGADVARCSPSNLSVAPSFKKNKKSHTDYRLRPINHNVSVGLHQTRKKRGALGRTLRAALVTEGPSPPVDTFEMPHEEISTTEILPKITKRKRVIMVRHGESTWNAEGRIQGSSDFAVLTSKGVSQAETSRTMLEADSFDVCFHSPLQRSAKTAEIIWGSRTGEMIPLFDLREIDLYAFQGLKKEEGKAQFGDQYRMWQKHASDFEIEGHFPVRELWERASGCWKVILDHPGDSILVVAHNAVNQALVATATGLGPEYFRQLLQSNCGVSVIDFSPRGEGEGPPHVRVNRLNQTPSPPVGGAGGQSGGRKAKDRLVLVCHGATESSTNTQFPASDTEGLNMLGLMQSRKTAELLLDLSVDSVLSSPQPCALQTAQAIVEVQEAADCLGADCVPRYVDLVELPELRDLKWGEWQGKAESEVSGDDRWVDHLQHSPVEGGEKVDDLWQRAGEAWGAILRHMARPWPPAEEGEEEVVIEEKGGRTVVVVGHELVYEALVGNALGLTQEWLGACYFNPGGVSVVDFPEGVSGKAIVRCLNYTAHLGRWAVPVTRPSLNDEDF